jgi:hypothetical protein
VSFLIGFMVLVIVPMLVSELTDWLPWMARHIVRTAARALPPNLRDRYAEEWDAELCAIPGGNLSQLAVALRICLGAHKTGAALRGLPSARPLYIKNILDRLCAAALLARWHLF